MAQNDLDFTEIFKQAKADKLIGINNWGIYNLENAPDAIPSEKMIEREGLFYSKEKFKAILYQVALAQKKVKSRILLTSYYGSGKTSILSYIHKITSEQSRLKGAFVSGSTDLDQDDKSLQYLCIDDVELPRMKEFLDNSQIPCILMSINCMVMESKEFIIKSMFISDQQEITKKLIFLDQWSSQDLMDLVDARLASLSLGEEPLKTIDLFSAETFHTLCSLVNHSPKALLQLITIIMRETYQINEHKIQIIPDEYLNDIFERHGLETFLKIKEKKLTLSDKKIEILKKIEFDKINPSAITSEIQKTKANTSEHLHGLRDLRLLEFEQKGKRRFYYQTLGGILTTEYLQYCKTKDDFKPIL